MISLYDLIEAANGQLFGEPAAQLFDDFCLDAEDARESLLFVAMKSDRGDSHQYIQEAIENGVSGVICNTPPECNTDGVSVILVKNTVTALLAWAHYMLGKYGTKVIGVTGSAGKSIAVDAIGRVLGSQFPVHVGMRSERSRISVPLALAQLKPTHRFAVLKLGTNQPGEMAAMVQAVQPEVGVITHLGIMHTDYFETTEQVAREMGILIDYLSPTGLAVLNYDDDLVRSMTGRTRAQTCTVGLSSFGADMMAYNVSVGLDATHFSLRHGSDRFTDLSIPLFGQYHLYSIMSALMIGLHFGIPLAEGIEALADLMPLPGRMNPLRGKGGALLMDDTYSANPQATLAALDWLEANRNNAERIFFVFGDMQDLGRHSRTIHRQVGQRAAQVVDVFISQGTQAAVSARAALDNNMDPQHVHITYATQDIITLLQENYQLKEKDILLLKGGAALRMEQVTRALLENPDDCTKLVRQGGTWDIAATGAQPTRLSWVEVDTDALANNVRRLKTMVGEDVTLMAVVKSDAYGHGAVITAQTALRNGANYLGVSSIREALELRDAGIEAPILVMNYTPVYMARQAIQQDLTLTLYDLDMAQAYNHVAREAKTRLRVHVKIDSGMGRLGTTPNEAIQLFRHLITMQNIEVEGVYTHFSMADELSDYTAEQLKVFRNVVRPVQATTGFKFRYLHAANSAATIAHPEAHLDMVRTGIAMYGMHPSEAVQLPEGFQPVLTWKTVIAQVKTLPPNHPVGYGNTYVTRREERVAVLPIGYSSGLRRAPKNWGEVLVHGQRAPIIGRVSMEKTVIKVTHIPHVSIGDEVVLLGRQQDKTITAEEIGRRLGTINYEVTTTILPHEARR